MHDISLITTIAAGFTGAWIFGLLTQRLGMSPIVGYLLAGVLIGPHTPGFTADVKLAQQLAEVGVILLMFGVGLHFHLKDLLAVRRIAIPGALGQSLVATVCGILIYSALGMSSRSGLVLGMAMAVASTVVLMRVLMDAHALNSPEGHAAVGWLIVEDILTVLLLVLIPVLAGKPASDAMGQAEVPAGALAFWKALGISLLRLGALVALVMFAGSKILPRILVAVVRLRSRELFTLTVLVIAVAVAAGSYVIFGASMALGAFLAGMVVAQSPVSHQAAADALPMRDAFAVLFFVSVGMLFDPRFLFEEPVMILAALGIILVAKPLAALFIAAVLGYPARTGLTVALGLAQIGEFSFILSDLARQHGLMPEAGGSVLVAAAILSISINPLIFRWRPALEARLQRSPVLWRLINGRAARRAARANVDTAYALATPEERASATLAERGLAIVVGYGPVGRSVDAILREGGLNTVITDLNMDTVFELREQGRAAIFGDASSPGILEQAGLARASHLVVTLPHSTDRAAVVATARQLNPDVRLLVRARYLRERGHLMQAGATQIVFEEAEAAVALSRLVLIETGADPDRTARAIHVLRANLDEQAG